jgi:hypothetical protein
MQYLSFLEEETICETDFSLLGYVRIGRKQKRHVEERFPEQDTAVDIAVQHFSLPPKGICAGISLGTTVCTLYNALKCA